MKERGSGLKTTSNEFMESVLETLLDQPSRKSILKLRMLPRCYLDVQILEENYFTNAAGSRITTTPLRKPETMFTPSFTLKSTLWLKALVTAAKAAGEEELDDSEDEYECQRKLYN